MTYRLFLLWSFVLIGRPQDLLTFLAPLRPALLLAIATLLAMLIEGHWRRLSTTIAKPESKRYLLFFAIMIIGVPFAYHRGTALEGVFKQYFPNLLFFLVFVAVIDSVQKLKGLVWIVCVSTFWYGLVGGLTYGGNFKGDAGRFQMAGQMFDANDTAYVLTGLFPFSLFYFYHKEPFLKRLLAALATVSAVAVILLTGSRGGALGLGTVVLVFLLMGGPSATHKLAFVLGIIGVMVMFGDKLDIERLLSLADVSSDYNVTADGGRIQIWIGAMEMIGSRPLLGVGYECAPFALYLMREASGASYLGWQHTHNAYLQVASEIGLVGFLVFLVMIVAAARTFARAGRGGGARGRTTEIETLGNLALLGFLGHLVTAFFLSQGYSVYFAFFFALAAVVRQLESEFSGSESRGQPVALPKSKMQKA